MSNNHEPLFRKLEYRFQNEYLLSQVLTHRSAGAPNNERLEFLGDALLNWVIADALYRLYPQNDEGGLTRLRASLVREATLAVIAQELGLGEHLVLGPGERRSGGFRRQSILADALEALIAGVYLDGGFEAARKVVDALYRTRLQDLPDSEVLKDAKTQLQEFLQGKGLPRPDYEVLEIAGQTHQQQFRVRCRISDDARTAEGCGSSRRRAEQAAAGQLLDQLKAAE